MNGSPARNSSRRLRLIRFAISPLHGRPTVDSLTVCPEPFQGAPARSISATGRQSGNVRYLRGADDWSRRTPDIRRRRAGRQYRADVEVLAAGLAGDNWALDAPSFTKGDRSP